jgi:hypothetical protein
MCDNYRIVTLPVFHVTVISFSFCDSFNFYV